MPTFTYPDDERTIQQTNKEKQNYSLSVTANHFQQK